MRWRLMYFGFNQQLNNDDMKDESLISSSHSVSSPVSSPVTLLELPTPPSSSSSLTINSCWHSLYVRVSTGEGKSLSLCRGEWKDALQEARKRLQEGDEVQEVIETRDQDIIVQSREGKILIIKESCTGSCDMKTCELSDVVKMRTMNNGGGVYLLLKSGFVHELDRQCLKLGLPLGGGGVKVTDISCGSDHCLLLSKTGNVFSFGLGTRGQLGHGDLATHLEPSLIDGLAGVPVKMISCGLWHNLVLTRTGDMYSWGWNRDGQLGVKDPQLGSTLAQPTLVDILSVHDGESDGESGGESDGESDVKSGVERMSECSSSIVCVSCGSRHSAAVSDRGILYCWGWNGYGQVKGGRRRAGGGGDSDGTAVGVVSGGKVGYVYCSHWATLYTLS